MDGRGYTGKPISARLINICTVLSITYQNQRRPRAKTPDMRNAALQLIYPVVVLESAPNTTPSANCTAMMVVCNWNKNRSSFAKHGFPRDEMCIVHTPCFPILCGVTRVGRPPRDLPQWRDASTSCASRVPKTLALYGCQSHEIVQYPIDHLLISRCTAQLITFYEQIVDDFLLYS